MRSILTCVTCMIFVTGCQSLQNLSDRVNGTYEAKQEAKRKAAEEEENRITHQYDGWSEDQVITEYGAPSKIETAGSFKIYYFIEDHGYSSTSSAGLIQNAAFGRSRTIRHFEQTTFFFKEGKVDHYDVDRQ